MDSDTSTTGPGTQGENAQEMQASNSIPASLLQQLQTATGRSVQSLLQILAGYLQVEVTGRVAAVMPVPFADFLQSMSPSSYLVSFPLAGTPAKAVLEFGPDFHGPALEVLLGAPAAGAPSERGPLTEIETHILGELFHLMAAAFATGWPARPAQVSPLSINPVTPAELAAEESSHAAIVATVRLNLDGAEGTVRVAFPSLAVRLLSNGSDGAGEPGGAVSNRERMMEILKAADLLLEVVLPESTIRMRDLMDLKKGQVLALNHNPHESVDCTVNGVKKFRGHIVTAGSRIGLQIQGPASTPAPLP